MFTTDGRIRSLNLKVLDDDRLFFPRYNLGVTLRADMLRQYPQITDVLAPVSAQLNNVELMKLNAQVDVEGRDPADVARDWMVEKGFVTLPGRAAP